MDIAKRASSENKAESAVVLDDPDAEVDVLLKLLIDCPKTPDKNEHRQTKATNRFISVILILLLGQFSPCFRV
ncbi:MAG: hypothetical protein K2K67_07030, partial [Treponemataceae bacterium]|nr:hypothetical protein [Treponemataceae bacterium]